MTDATDKHKRVTLTDVARHAGVSRATASLAIRDSPLVAEATRSEILASMSELGYVHNRAAASLRTNRTHTVGLAITDIRNPFFAQMTVGSEAQLGKDGYALLLANTPEQVDRQDHLLETMHEYGIDGVLFCPAKGTPSHVVDRLRRWRLPAVLVARYLPGVKTSYVGADNVLGRRHSH